MTLLGQFALWAAFALGVWCVLLSFSGRPSTEVAIRSSLQEDLYIVYAGSVDGTEEAVYRFNINPLVWWVWFGGFVLALGGIITMWPGGGPRSSTPRRAQAGYEVTLAGAGKD